MPGYNNIIEDATGSGDVTAGANLTDNALLRGDGGAKGIQDSGWLLSDLDVLTAAGNLNLNSNGIVFPSGTYTDILDDDSFATASATTGASSESIKAYVDAQVATADTWAEVLANGNSSGGTNVEITSGDVINATSAALVLTTTTSGNIQFSPATSSDYVELPGSDDKMRFYDASLSAFSATDRIEINDNDGNNSDLTFRVGGGSNALINFATSNGADLSSRTATVDGDDAGAIIGWGYGFGGGGTSYGKMSQIKLEADGNVTTTLSPGKITFWTTASNAGNNLTQRAIIDADGHLGINVVNPVNFLDVTVDNNDNVLAALFTQSDATNNPNAVEISNAGSGNSLQLSGAGTRSIDSASGNLTLSTTTSGTLTVSSAGAMVLDGTGVSGTLILDEDNMASDSATHLATQQSIKAYVDSQVATVDTLAEVLAIGNTTGGTDIEVSSGDAINATSTNLVLSTTTSGNIQLNALNNQGTIDLDGRIDQDVLAVDNGADYIGAEFALQTLNTIDNSNNHIGLRGLATLNDGNNLTSGAGGLIGVQGYATVSSTGTVTSARGSEFVLAIGAAGTITEGIGISIYGIQNAGTFTEMNALYLENNTGTIAGNYFMKLDSSSDWLSNSRALPVDNGGANRYIMLSNADTGLTLDSQNVVIATTTSGDVDINAASVVDIDAGSTMTIDVVSTLTTTANTMTFNPTNNVTFNMNTGRTFTLLETSDDAGGPILILRQNSTSPAIDDVPGTIQFKAEDDASNNTIYGAIFLEIVDPVNTQESGELNFQVIGDSSLKTLLRINGDDETIYIGDGAGQGIVSSFGNHDLVLQTGNATTGDITITDGANGDITINPDGTGSVVMGGDVDFGANHAGFTQQTVTYNSGTTTVDWGAGNKASMTFGAGNITTFAFTNPPKPSSLTLKIVQDGTGGRTVGTWDADIKWAGGSAPTLSTGSGAIDLLSFYFDGTNYFGTFSANFS